MPEIVSILCVAVIISYFGVSILRSWTERRQIMAIPNEHSFHARPVPLGGGLSIVFITLAGVWLSCTWLGLIFPWRGLLAYTMGAFLVSLVSWWDDMRSLSYRVRLAVHACAALLVIWGLGEWYVAPALFLNALHLEWLSFPLTFFWIVGLTNAYNFMDGIDGLAGGQAVVAGIGWCFFGYWSDQYAVSILGMLLAASSLGFLGHNWPPARIFMGDAGSIFLGYTFAVLTIVAARPKPVLFLSGILLLWPFIFDTAFTLVRRLHRRENVFMAHHSHLYQRLVMQTIGQGIAMLSMRFD